MSENLTDRVEECLRADITSGALMPSSPLRVTQLASRYGAGPTPTREALSRLLPEGLVEITANKGFRVRGISREDLLDLTSARTAVELEALRDSIMFGDDAWESGIVAAKYRMRKVFEATPEYWANADFEPVHAALHLALISGTNSSRLINLATQLATQHMRYQRLFVAWGMTKEDEPISEYAGSVVTPRMPDAMEFLRIHDELADSVLTRDLDSASSMMRDHLQLIIRVLDDGRFWEQAMFALVKKR